LYFPQVYLISQKVRSGKDNAARCESLNKYLAWLAINWRGGTFKNVLSGFRYLLKGGNIEYVM